ncbi:MAG: hypothetical protein ACHQ9S_24065 [Candidatus Binatia bacterium]
MVLKFPGAWRFNPPAGGSLNTTTIPEDAIQEFGSMIHKVATQGDLQEYLEHFKGHFCAANGTTHIWSSNSSWAETDLYSAMRATADNPPLFLEAFFDACDAIRKRPGELFAPDADMINAACRKHEIGYELRLPELVLRDTTAKVIPVPERPPTLAEKGHEILTASLRRAEDLLEAGRGREAVQETLWLLETVTTAFRGVDTGSGTVEGKYFNKIVTELRQAAHGTTLDRVLEWATAIHGYLSSPTGGGVRHGVDLRQGLELSLNEAKLFCNLIRSYLSFLLSEHERMNRGSVL